MGPQRVPRTIVAAVSAIVALVLCCGAPARADDRSICVSQDHTVEDVLQACTRIITSRQDVPLRDKVIAFDRRGEAFVKQGELEPALSDFDSAVDLAPNYPFARLDRANVLQKTGDLERSLTDLDRAVSVLPKGFVLLQRAHLRWAKNDLHGAIADFTEAARLEPDQPFGFLNRGTIHVLLGEVDEGIADFDAAAKIEPAFAEIYVRRAEAYRRKGDAAKALADLSKIIALEPRSAAAYETRASTYAGIGKFDLAILDYRTAIGFGGAVPDTYLALGIVYMQAHDDKAAIAQFDAALGLDPKLVAALRHRAIAYQNLGMATQAQADRTKADQIDAAATAAFLTREKKAEDVIFGPNGDLQKLDNN